MYKVLLVDDVPFILEGLKHIINWEEHGLEIAGSACDGDQALEILEQTNINIVITDIKMPNMSGLELIKRIKQKGMNQKCIILSGYDDFQYVKEAVKLGIENYLLKPVNEDELSSTLLTITDKIESDLYNYKKARIDSSILRENILQRWVSGRIDKSELLERLAFLDIDLNCSRYLVSIMRLLKYNEFTDEGKLMRFASLNICNELTQQVCRGIAFTDLNGDIILFFSGTDTEFVKEDIRNIIKQCVDNISDLLDINVFAAIGSCTSDLMMIQQSYNSAKALMNYCLLTPHNSVMDYEESITASMGRQKVISIDFNELKKIIASKNKTAADSFIDELLHNLYKLEGITPAYFQNILIEIFYNISIIAASLKVDTNTLFNHSENLFLTIVSLETMDELSEWIKNIIGKIITCISANNADMNPFLQKIIHYIESNYWQDISLKTISATFNINTAYLGQLFKAETGDMFTNYLNRIRIEKAKELLKETKLSAKEIALKIGYSNPNYFYSIFKKLTGDYPTKFKRDKL